MRHDCFSISHRIFCFPAGAGPAILRVNQQPDVQLERCGSLRPSLAAPPPRWTGVPSLRASAPLPDLRVLDSTGSLDGVTAQCPPTGIAARHPLGRFVQSRWNDGGTRVTQNRERPLDV